MTWTPPAPPAPLDSGRVLRHQIACQLRRNQAYPEAQINPRKKIQNRKKKKKKPKAQENSKIPPNFDKKTLTGPSDRNVQKQTAQLRGNLYFLSLSSANFLSLEKRDFRSRHGGSIFGLGELTSRVDGIVAIPLTLCWRVFRTRFANFQSNPSDFPFFFPFF